MSKNAQVLAYDDLTNGQTKAAIAKLGGAAEAMRLLRGELLVTEWPYPWKRVEDHVLTYSVPGNDIESKHWWEILQENVAEGNMGPETCSLIACHGPHPISKDSGDLMILRGSFFKDEDRTRENANAEAKRRGWCPAMVQDALVSAVELQVRQMEKMGTRSLMFMHPAIELNGVGFFPGPHDLMLGYNDLDRKYFHGTRCEPNQRLSLDTNFVFRAKA